MQVAVLSDIHGNRHALDAVLADADDRGCTDVWCLGDVVGYGADPAGCCDTVRRSASACIAGNHDLVSVGVLSDEDFSPVAAEAARWTGAALGAEDRDWLAGLPASLHHHGQLLAHGSPVAPRWDYVLSEGQAAAALAGTEEQVVLVGHSHIALSFAQAGRDRPLGARRADGEEAAIGARRWIANPGSVGQPRDDDPRAAWLELDLRAGRLRWHRVPYDVAGAGRAIVDAGLPEVLAERLQHGR